MATCIQRLQVIIVVRQLSVGGFLELWRVTEINDMSVMTYMTDNNILTDQRHERVAKKQYRMKYMTNNSQIRTPE